MKKIIILFWAILIYSNCSSQHSKPEYSRGVYFYTITGADTYLAKPIAGVGYVVKITDFKHKFVINWQNAIVSKFDNKNLIHYFNLCILHKGKKIDYGISPMGFWWNIVPNGKFIPTASLTLNKKFNEKIDFQTSLNYYFNTEIKKHAGITACINYKIFKLKNL